MKKKLLGVVLLSALTLTGCKSEQKKEVETATSKVEQLESRVKELESSGSSEEEDNKHTDEEIKEYLNKEYKNEYTKEFVKKAYDEGIFLYHKGVLGVYESDDNDQRLEEYGQESFITGFTITKTQNNDLYYWIYKYDNDELFDRMVLARENPEEYAEQNPEGPYVANPTGKLVLYNKINKTEFLVLENSNSKQEKLIEIFNSFK